MNIKDWLLKKYLDAKSFSNLVCLKKKMRDKKGDKIRVVFICQYIPAWNKAVSIYNEMKNNSRFEVSLLCVPGIAGDKKFENSDNDTYDYYINNNYEAVNSLNEDGTYKELKSINPDYVFYLRPYDEHLPEVYRASTVCKYAKVCIVLYGMVFSKEDMIVAVNRNFFRNVYMYFAETKAVEEKNKKSFRLTHWLGLQKTVYHGMPALKMIADAADEKSESWSFSDNKFRVMWTPRWTTDPKLGGSNFFTYKDWFFDYADKNRDADFLFRPHPLAFDNFIKTGEMTEEEVEEYKKRCEQTPNVSLDKQKEYVGTMWESSVLVSDISGVMPEYFVTGKPIIYCASNMELHIVEHTKMLLSGCYIVNNAAELEVRLDKLKRGEDELFDKRQHIIQELFGKSLDNPAGMIVQEIVKDWSNK